MDEERILISNASAEAVAVAMETLANRLPDASEARRLLMIMANAAVSCGRLRVAGEDVLALVEAAYNQGARMKQEVCLFPGTPDTQ